MGINSRFFIGNAVHEKIQDFLIKIGWKVEVSHTKSYESYTLWGRCDAINKDKTKLIEIKHSSFLPSQPKENDVLQVKIYLNLFDVEVGYLWYVSPDGFKEFVVEDRVEDEEIVNEEIVNLIENSEKPMWDWECRYCSVKNCKKEVNK